MAELYAALPAELQAIRQKPKPALRDNAVSEALANEFPMIRPRHLLACWLLLSQPCCSIAAVDPVVAPGSAQPPAAQATR